MLQSNWDEVVDNFDDMGLKEDLLRGVYAYGFEKPSAIQQRAIIPCVKGFDVIAQAQSGTGKTATFAVAILQKLDVTLKECQALVLAPTRELAQQVSDQPAPLCLFNHLDRTSANAESIEEIFICRKELINIESVCWLNLGKVRREYSCFLFANVCELGKSLVKSVDNLAFVPLDEVQTLFQSGRPVSNRQL